LPLELVPSESDTANAGVRGDDAPSVEQTRQLPASATAQQNSNVAGISPMTPNPLMDPARMIQTSARLDSSQYRCVSGQIDQFRAFGVEVCR
jgi:hypothetical protein